MRRSGVGSTEPPKSGGRGFAAAGSGRESPLVAFFFLAAVFCATRDRLAARVRPLSWGLTAALLGTMAANVFYLTMSFLYFYVFAMLVLVTPTVFARARG
jgi:hypothetical protein